MKRIVTVAAGLLALVSLGSAPSAPLGAGQEKSELRVAFEKGKRYPLAFKFGIQVKMDEIPEALAGFVGEEPINLKFDCLLDAEVKDVAENGRATLEAAWKKLTVKGSMMTEALDYQFDPEKKGETKAKKSAGESAIPGFGNIEDELAQLTSHPVKLAVDRQGRVTVSGGTTKGVGGMTAQFMSLNGFLGDLPREKVGKGDTWKGEDKLVMAATGLPLAIKILSENTYAGNEKVGDRDCAVITSKLSVGTGDGDKKDGAAALPIEVKMKMSGDGEAKTWFALKEGLPAKSQQSLKVKMQATIVNPGDNSELELKATIKIEQAYEVGK